MIGDSLNELLERWYHAHIDQLRKLTFATDGSPLFMQSVKYVEATIVRREIAEGIAAKASLPRAEYHAINLILEEALDVFGRAP